MQEASFGKRLSFGLAALAAAAALVAVCPSRAVAASYVAHSTDDAGNVTYYGSADAAVAYCSVDVNGADGPTVVMDADWKVGKNTSHSSNNTDGSISIEKGKKLKIDMCGHTIENEQSSIWYDKTLPTFSVKDGAELTLTSSKRDAVISYRGYKTSGGKRTDLTATTGGLVTNVSNTKSAFVVGRSSTLTLDGVAVAGCSASQDLTDDGIENTYHVGKVHGAITLANNATLNMKNGASVEHNMTLVSGGGVYCEGKSTTVNIDNSSVHDNLAEGSGGGIFFDDANATLNMSNGASVRDNVAKKAGGGVYLFDSQFNVICSGGKAFISGNRAEGTSTYQGCGGGIYAHQMFSGDDEGLIKGITISDNYSAWDGGGIELNQENTTLKDCIITGNTSACEGGGVLAWNDDNVIDGCTITGNACNLSGKSYGGGGVFVSCTVDLKLQGTCLIYGNTRGENSGNADDLFLNENAGASAKAYVTGGVKKGSKVGIRTGIDGDRRIGEKINNETKDSFFIDLDGYYVSYGTDNGGDMWQRHRTLEFAASVNGTSVGRYKYKDSVSVNALSAGTGKVFKCWNTADTTGLYPIGDYIKDATDPLLSFKMPQCDVSLVAEYVTRIGSVTLATDPVIAGDELPSTGTLSWKDESGEACSLSIPIAWLKKTGAYQWAPASGEADYSATYRATASVAQDLDQGIAFALGLKAGNVKVQIGSTTFDGTFSAEVDGSGALNVITPEVTTKKPSMVSLDELAVTVKVGASESEFRKMVPATVGARTNAGTSVNLTVSKDSYKRDLTALIESGTVKTSLAGSTVNVWFPVACEDKSVSVPDNAMVKVVVTVTDQDTPAKPATPTVTPEAGTYATSDTDKFSGDKLVLTIAAKDGAQVNYSVSRYNEESKSWEAYSNGIDSENGQVLLEKAAGACVNYEVEVWSVATSEVDSKEIQSDHAWYAYTIDDVQHVARKVTVAQTDTGKGSVGVLTGSKSSECDVEDGETFSFTAPYREGYVFEKWQKDGKDAGTEATIRLESVTAETTLTAVYNPVVTEIDLEISAPEADTDLAATVSSATAKAGTSDKTIDIMSYLKDDGAITWLPSAGKSGKAAHDTFYTAEIALKDSLSSGNVKYVLSSATKVLQNGSSAEYGAYVAERGGSKYLYVVFSNTGAYEFKSAANPDTVKLSFDEALTYSEEKSSNWGLPDTVKVSYACGETAWLPVEWTAPAGFDENATGVQALTATGTIKFPSSVSASDSTTVSCSIEVAAPGSAEAPVADPEPGTYTGTQLVWLSCATEGAQIYYTTDGTEPTEKSMLYEGPIALEHSATVKARAYRAHMKASDVVELSYTIVHSVSFIDDGSETARETVADGKKVKRPSDPSHEGFVFEGWYTEDGKEYDFKSAVTADLALYAHWSAKGEDATAHVVTFDTAGGSKVADSPVAHGATVKRPDDPTKDGYTFEGWFTKDGKEYDFATPVTENLTLYAHWTAKDDGAKKDDTSDNGSKANATKATTVTTTKSESKGLAATGDRTPLIVGALVVLGILIVIAGVITNRRKK